MKHLLKHRIDNILVYICYFINIIIPKNKKQIFFYSMPDYSDNARAIFEELVRQGRCDDYKVVWAVRDIKKYENNIPNAVVVQHRTLKNLFYYCRSHYIFRTHSLWGNLYVGNRQKMFVAWHGMPLKSLLEGNPKPYKCDFVNTTSDFFKEHIYSSVAVPKGENPNVGLARNDLLFAQSRIIEDFKLDCFNRIYLWMPTFRNSIYSDYVDGVEGEIGIPVISKEDLIYLNNILQSKNEVLILKLHPWSADKFGELSFSNIKNIKDNDIIPKYSLYELLGKIDVLITDYSSVYIDFLLTDKPIWFVYDDIEDYRKTRGFAYEPAEDYMPGIKIRTKEELFDCFSGMYNDSEYISFRNRVKKNFYQYYDDKSSERALKVMGIL